MDQEPETEVQGEINVIEVRHVMLEPDQSRNHAITSAVQVGHVVSVGGVQVDHVVTIADRRLIYAGQKRISGAQKWTCPIGIAKMAVEKIIATGKLIQMKSFPHSRVLSSCTSKTYRCQQTLILCTLS